MLLGPWLSPLLGALLCSSSLTLADESTAQPGSSSFQGKDPCPAHCNVAGPISSNWSVYHNLDQLQRCPQKMFLDFSIYEQIDDPAVLHRLRACTVWGADWENVPAIENSTPATEVNATYQLGWWNTDGSETGTVADAHSLARHMRTYFANGYGPTNRTALVFGLSENATIGIYLGKSLQNEGMGEVAFKNFIATISTAGVSGGLAMQLCGPGRDADHVFGIIAAVNGTFAAVQSAVQSWSKAECLDGFAKTSNITGPIFVTAPPLVPISNSTNMDELPGLNNTNSTSRLTTTITTIPPAQSHGLARRGDCTTIQVASGDGCASLAAKCGISGNTFMTYNPQPNLCSTLQPLQHVCCSAGTLPNFQPKQNPDGSCATYTTLAGDSCYAIAAAHSLATTDLENFNKHTWGWNGCSNLWVGVNMCLSTGTPPMPAVVANAVCGPQVPGTAKPPAGTDLSTLNPCLLNACCDVWGQCGTTAEFCTNTSTGAPGTAKAGTNGCISNCGTNIVRSAPPATFMSVAYFEGFNLGRACLNMDVHQLNTAKYTHIHFAFATLTPQYQVVIGDGLASFEFTQFLALNGPKRILSFGGWDFSTGSNTYTIFRNGVTAANRLTMATNIANFIKANNLDGVDMDWEYPGAPDIPGIPPASTSDGANYLAFLVLLKNMLPGKTVSVAAPASYWYLKGFPIKQIGQVVDYVIYMTYDLHGQWDYGNKWSDPGCPGGNCLRSDVNITETINALVMITKAGVPSNKVVVGVTSYGRAFRMTTPGCYGEMCTFTGSASGATPGPCTGVAGYISDAEIKQIVGSNRVNNNFFDVSSQTDILVYDNVQWVSWMSPATKAIRVNLYKALDMGGISDWAVDLEDYQPDPIPAGWHTFIQQIKLGVDPYIEGSRTGNWTSLTCTDQAVEGVGQYTADQRWAMLDCDNAWSDAINIWKTIDYPAKNLTFGLSIANTYHTAELSNCDSLVADSNCDATIICTQAIGTGSGPAGYEVANSLIVVHEMYKNYYTALFQVAGFLFSGFQAFENDFAPLPTQDDSQTLQILLDLIGLGALMVAAPFFNSYLASMPFFVANANLLGTLKDGSYAIIQTAISIVKDLTGGGSTGVEQWTASSQAAFSAYMGQAIWAWGNVTEQALHNLFNGTDPSIQTLTTLISHGQLIEGSEAGKATQAPGPPSNAALQASIVAAFYAYTIPAAWSLTGTKAVVIDSGYACGTQYPLSAYFSNSIADATNACYNNKLYYIVSPKGPSEYCGVGSCDGCVPVCTPSFFSQPNGIDKLDGNAYGGLTVTALVKGSVRTWQNNGNKNGGPPASVTNNPTVDDLYNQDVTTPGYIRLPVCGPDEAYSNWYNSDQAGGNTTYANYPCNP